MNQSDETHRLEQVYKEYARDAETKARWSLENRGNQMVLEERRSVTRRLLESAGYCPLSERTILDLGCGSGAELAALLEWGASNDRLHGVDLLAERVARARESYPELRFEQMNAESLTFKDESFDIVLVYTVFTSILDPQMAKNVAAEIVRVLKPGGSVVWYDFRYDNPRNANVRGLGSEDVRKLFAGLTCDLRTITLLPPLARRLGNAAPFTYPLLSAFPPLRTHLLGLLTKPA